MAPILLLLGSVLLAGELGSLDLNEVKQGASSIGQGQKRMSEQRAALRTRFLEGLSVFASANITQQQLIERYWRPEHVADGAEALKRASEATKLLYQKHPSAVADAYDCRLLGGSVGTMTNMEDTAKMLGGGNLERGCISHQSTALAAAFKKDSSIEVKKIMYGKVLEHHAVVMYPKGEEWAHSGIIIDAWLCQRAQLDKMTYLYKNWSGLGLTVRLEDE
jgi:hypothetical protein